VNQTSPRNGAATEQTNRRGFFRVHGVKLAVSIVIAAGFVWTLNRGGLPLVPARDALERVDVGMCVEYLAVCAVWLLIRAARWRHLLAPIAPVPTRRVIAVSFIGFTAVLLLPLRAGELVRPYLIRDGSKISMVAATGTIGAERIIDGLSLTLLLGVCLQIATPLSPLPDHIGRLPIPVAAVPFYAYLALAGFVFAFTLMALFYWRARWGYLLVERTFGLVSKKLAKKASSFVARLADGLKFLPSFRHFGPFMIETVIYWTLNGFSIWLLARACGLDQITVTQAFVVLGVLGVGIIVPGGPGMFGAFQASTYAALAMFFHDDVVLGAGAVFVFLLYVFQVSLQIVSGAIGLALEKKGTVPAALHAKNVS
jgi:uncharacterized protein (TIRG00374 family)